MLYANPSGYVVTANCSRPAKPADYDIIPGGTINNTVL